MLGAISQIDQGVINAIWLFYGKKLPQKKATLGGILVFSVEIVSCKTTGKTDLLSSVKMSSLTFIKSQDNRRSYRE